MRAVAEGEKKSVKVGSSEVSRYLGSRRFDSETAELSVEPGIVTGLAATSVGGEIIFVEATKMPGHKGLILTGQLGDVMRESAQAALSYVKSNYERFGLEPDFHDKVDIHIHVPAGAQPKEGHSAGVTLATALVSLLTGRKARVEVAMTGEITLRGRIMPVGGVKEKVLAAQRAGITTVILPKKNRKDLEDIPPATQKELTFRFASTLDEVLGWALEEK